MLFIIPAFMLCLLFTNLQPRFLIAIYQNIAQNNFNIRQILCRFNLMHYGSLFLIYPIIILTNFNWLFFIGLSCIIFPQIYTNGTINIRPDLSSAYYSQYLLSRFILIVSFFFIQFYLKCFPYNVFGFKPDYALGLICLFLIVIQVNFSLCSMDFFILKSCMDLRKYSLASCQSLFLTINLKNSSTSNKEQMIITNVLFV